MRGHTKIWLITAAALVLVGCAAFAGVMSALSWDFFALSTSAYDTREYEISDSFINVSILSDTADITFVTSEESRCKVVCHDQENLYHEVTIRDNTLYIELKDIREWYEYVDVNFGSSYVTVYLPSGEYGSLSADISTGDVSIKGVSASALSVSVCTGDVCISDTSISDTVQIHTSTGDSTLQNVTCNTLSSDGTTGKVNLTRVIASDNISIKRSTGDVTFDSCDAAELTIKTSTGDVVGTLLTTKIFKPSSSSGSVSLPEIQIGGVCEIKTSTGDIEISVVAEDAH